MDLSISEAARIMGITETVLRKMDFPFTITKGKHRRYNAKDIQDYVDKKPFEYQFSTIIKSVNKLDLRKGVNGIIPKKWQDTNIEIKVVKEWNYKDDVYLNPIKEPEGFSYSAMFEKYESEYLKEVVISFSRIEKNWKPKELPFRDTGKLRILNSPNGIRWYNIYEREIKGLYLWSIGSPSLWLVGETAIPSKLFVLV